MKRYVAAEIRRELAAAGMSTSRPKRLLAALTQKQRAHFRKQAERRTDIDLMKAVKKAARFEREVNGGRAD